MKIEVEIPGDAIIWRRSYELKDVEKQRTAILFVIDCCVRTGTYLRHSGKIHSNEAQITPEQLGWWAHIPVPPNCSESDVTGA
jgi:hypothetical protein